MKGYSILVFFVSCLCACTSTQVTKGLQPLLTNGSHDVTVTVLSISSGFDSYQDSHIEECISSAMQETNSKLRLLPSKQFRDNLFPYFMPSTTPHSSLEYQKLLDTPVIKKRLARQGIHYLVSIRKVTDMDKHGGIGCGAGPGGGGCFGAIAWKRKSIFEATIWDLFSSSTSGTTKVSTAGTGIVISPGLPIPVYFPATESAACNETGKQLGQAFGGVE